VPVEASVVVKEVNVPGERRNPARRIHVKKLARRFWRVGIVSNSKSIAT
jgi:hypothetical protein